MTYILPQDGYDTFITAALGTSDTEIAVNVLPTQSSGVLTIYDQDGRTIREKIYYTGTSGAGTAVSPYKLTGVTRGFRSVPVGGVILFTSDSTLVKTHGANRRIAMTDNIHYLGVALAVLNGDMETGGVMKNPASRTISDNRHLADKEYVDLIAAGAGGISSLLVSDAGGITINVAAGRLVSSDGVLTYAGVSGQALTNNATNYVEMKPDATLTINTTGFTAGYMPLAIVVTLSGDITSVTDTRGFFTSPAPERTITTDFTYGATIAAGDPLYYDTATSKVKKALATGASTADSFVGIALDAGVDTDTKKRVQIGGFVTSGLSGLTPGFQFLTDAGGLSTAPGTYRKLIGYAPTATSLILFPGIRPSDLAGVSSAVTAAMLEEAATFFATPKRSAVKYTGTAGHALAANEVVAIESDGRMYRTRPTALPTTNQGTATTLATTQLTDEDKCLWFDQASEFQRTLVALETNAAPDTIRVFNIVVDNNFDAISSNANATITPATSINHFSAEVFNTNSLAVVFDDNSTVKIAIVGSIDGSPSAGSNVSLEASSNGGAVADTSVTNTIVAFSSGGGAELRSHKVTVSGTTPTESTNAAMVSEANAVPNAAKRFTGTDFIGVAYVNTGTGKLKFVIGEYNPTTGGWTSVGTPIELESSGADSFSDVVIQVLSSTKVAVAWRKTDMKCAVITRTGTVAAVGNILTAISTVQDEGMGFKMLSKYSALISGGTTGGGKMQLVALDRDQTEFSLVGSPYTNDSATNRGIIGCLLHPERLLVVYQGADTSSSFRTQELTTNIDSAVGIVEAAVAALSTEEIVVDGYMSGFTGLTAGAAYYTNIDGQLVASKGGSGTRTANQGKPGSTKRAAVGLSATEVLVTL